MMNISTPEERGNVLLNVLGVKRDKDAVMFCSCGNNCGKIFLAPDFDISVLEQTQIGFKWHVEKRTAKIIVYF